MWLLKSEPSSYSWDKLVKDGHTIWDGVRNYTARNNLRAMKVGDEAFFYHSNEGLEIVGIVQIIKAAYPDPSAEVDTWSVVEIAPLKKLKKPVTLAQIKADRRLTEMQLVKLSRLSVSTVTEQEWKVILELAGDK
jgi:predicted RNA-binding protein with PUA-like domain